MTLLTKIKKSIAFSLTLLLLVLTNPILFAQTGLDPYQDLFLYAQKLEKAGALEEAELEYKRYLFLQDYSAGLHQTQAFIELARLYEKKEEWELAAQTMQKAILSQAADLCQTGNMEADLNKLRIEHIRLLQKSEENKNKSFTENLFIFSYMNLPDFSDSVRQYAILAAIENDLKDGRNTYAQKSYNLLTNTYPDFFNAKENQIISSNFLNMADFKPKKQMLAAYLSLFPGLGQLYAAHYKDSLNAFLLNGSIIAVSTYSLLTLDLWTLTLLEFNPLIHFMQGNIYNAQKDVYDYNSQKLRGYQEKILESLAAAKERIENSIK